MWEVWKAWKVCCCELVVDCCWKKLRGLYLRPPSAKGGKDDLSDGISKLDLESPSSLKFDELKIAESVILRLEVTIRHHEYLVARPAPHTRCQKRDHLLTTWGGATTRRVLNPFTSNTGRRLFNEKFSFTSSLFDMTRERVFSTRVKGEV